MRFKEKKEKRTKSFLIVIFIVIIMASSTIAYIYIKPSEEDKTDYRYNNYEFFKAEQGWITTIGNTQFLFDYNPGELEEISVKDLNLNIENKAYITLDMAEKDNNMDYSINKLGRTIRYAGRSVFLACINEENCPDIPLVDCDNQNKVFYLKKAEKNKVYMKDNCVVIEGDAIGISKLVDRISYSLLGVM